MDVRALSDIDVDPGDPWEPLPGETWPAYHQPVVVYMFNAVYDWGWALVTPQQHVRLRHTPPPLIALKEIVDDHDQRH